MIRENIAGDVPQIDSTSFVDPSAVMHHVDIGDGVFIRINSILEGVRVLTEKFVDINSVINSQDGVESLRFVTEEEKAFIERAISENSEFPIRYKFSLDS